MIFSPWWMAGKFTDSTCAIPKIIEGAGNKNHKLLKITLNSYYEIAYSSLMGIAAGREEQ